MSDFFLIGFDRKEVGSLHWKNTKYWVECFFLTTADLANYDLNYYQMWQSPKNTKILVRLTIPKLLKTLLNAV